MASFPSPLYFIHSDHTHLPSLRFIVFDYASRYHVADGSFPSPSPLRPSPLTLFNSPTADLATWVDEGKIKVRETRLVGLDKCVEGLAGLFTGANTGKAVVKVGGGGTKL